MNVQSGTVRQESSQPKGKSSEFSFPPWSCWEGAPSEESLEQMAEIDRSSLPLNSPAIWLIFEGDYKHAAAPLGSQVKVQPVQRGGTAWDMCPIAPCPDSTVCASCLLMRILGGSR